MYNDFVVNVADGDSLFVHSMRSLIGWPIMYLTHGPWNHVGILTARGTVLEAVRSGVGEYPLRRYFDGQQYLAVLRPPLTPDQQQAIQAEFNAKKGTPSGYRLIFRLFLKTLFNEHADYRFKFTIDVLIVLGLIYLLIPFHVAKIAVVAIAAAYLFVLGVNSLNRLRAALRLYEDYLEYASPKAHLPINSSPNQLFRRLSRRPGVGHLSKQGQHLLGNLPKSGPA